MERREQNETSKKKWKRYKKKELEQEWRFVTIGTK